MVMPFPEVAASTPNSLGRSATVGTAPELPPPDAVVAAPPPDAVVAAPPDAVVAAPPPDAVVALVPLPELSPPHAASTLGASATAAPAAPSRVSTCRRVTRPSWTGRVGSFSAIVNAPCVVAEPAGPLTQRPNPRAREPVDTAAPNRSA